MSFRILGIVTFLFVTGGLANPIQAQEPVHRDEFGLEESDAERVDEEKAAGEGGLFTHYQVGVFHRLATNVTNETKQSYLVTGDLSFLRKSRFESSFGGGVHFAFDDAGHRLGLKGLWRTPLKKGTWSYFQLAPGIYVSGTENRLDFQAPSFFLEAELGLARAFALVVAAEAIRYRDRSVAYEMTGPYGEWETVKEDGTGISLFIGAKVGNKVAAGATLVGLIAGGIVLASFASSGGFM